MNGPTVHQRLHGVLPVLQMPFTQTGEIDFETLGKEANWLLALGAHGLVVGMVSEVLRLSDSERTAVAEYLGELAASANTHFVMSVGAESTRQAIDNGRRAQDAGATEVMAISPIAVNLPHSEVLRYYEALISALNIPVVVQDASGYIGTPLPIDMMAKLCLEFQDQVLFKPEAVPIGPRLTELRSATDGRAKVFEGTGGISLIDSVRRGISGTMPGSDVCWSILRMWQAMSEDDFETAYRIQGPLLALLTIQTSMDSFIAVEKHLLYRQGIFGNTLCRGPVGYELDEETKQEVDRAFEQLLDVCDRPATGATR